MEKDLFEQLLRVGVGRQECLTRTPSAREWERLHAMCLELGLLGIGYQGACQCRKYTEVAREMSRRFFLQWHLEAEELRAQNRYYGQQCMALEKVFGKEDLKVGILKGQALAARYQDERCDLRLLRECGDIDLWVEGGRERVLPWLKKQYGAFHFDYKHAQPKMVDDIPVEVHWIPEILTNLRANHRLQRYWQENRDQLAAQLVALPEDAGSIHTLAEPVNTFYVLLHCYRHFLLGGVGMKQVVDLYFMIEQLEPKHRAEMLRQVHSFGMDRFVSAMMWVLHTVFGLEECLLLGPADENEGRFLLKELYRYGQQSKCENNAAESKWSKGRTYICNNLRHLRNVFGHYPSEALWAPVWMVTHYGWKTWYKFIHS